jgi:hypothetical protein
MSDPYRRHQNGRSDIDSRLLAPPVGFAQAAGMRKVAPRTLPPPLGLPQSALSAPRGRTVLDRWENDSPSVTSASSFASPMSSSKPTLPPISTLFETTDKTSGLQPSPLMSPPISPRSPAYTYGSMSYDGGDPFHRRPRSSAGRTTDRSPTSSFFPQTPISPYGRAGMSSLASHVPTMRTLSSESESSDDGHLHGALSSSSSSFRPRHGHSYSASFSSRTTRTPYWRARPGHAGRAHHASISSMESCQPATHHTLPHHDQGHNNHHHHHHHHGNSNNGHSNGPTSPREFTSLGSPTRISDERSTIDEPSNSNSRPLSSSMTSASSPPLSTTPRLSLLDLCSVAEKESEAVASAASSGGSGSRVKRMWEDNNEMRREGEEERMEKRTRGIEAN